MIASGLLALLTLQFVKHFLSSTAVLDHYYKAYYMARGGMEAMLTQANLRGYGFEYNLADSPVAANYYSGCSASGLCQLQGRTIARGESINNTVQSLSDRACSSEAMITLQPGQTSAYPLFYDRGEGSALSFDPVENADYERNAHNGYQVTVSGGTLEAFLYDAGLGSFGQITATDHIAPPTIAHLFSTQSITYTHRLILSNPVDHPVAVSYCLQSDETAQKLVGNFTTIRSQATYEDTTVGLTAIKKFVFPSAFIQ